MVQQRRTIANLQQHGRNMNEAELTLMATRPRVSLAEWLTVERAGYIGATLLALGLRLFDLGRQALTPAEAAQALPAWQAGLARAFDAAGASPLLFHLQRILFIAFPADDAAARWWPALLGGLAPLLFFALRDRLGRGGALAAALLWACSPLAVFTSRLGLGYGLVPPLALALLAALNLYLRDRPLADGQRAGEVAATNALGLGSEDFDRSAETISAETRAHGRSRDVSRSGDGEGAAGQRGALAEAAKMTAARERSAGDVSRSGEPGARWLVWAGIALGLLLTAGAGAYTVLLIALVAAVIWPGGWRAIAEGIASRRRSVGLATFLALALGATGFLTLPGGLALTADMFGRWLPGLISGPGAGYSPWDVLRSFLIAEPLLLAAAVGGMVLAWRRGELFGKLVALAAALALVAAVLGSGRHPGELGLVVLALALLAGPAVAWTASAAASWMREQDAWLLLLLSLSLLVAASIGLVTALNYPIASNRLIYSVVTLVTGLLCVGLWFVFYTAGSRNIVGRTLPAFGLIVGLVWGISQLAGVNYNTDANRHNGVLVETADPGWRLLREELRSFDGVYGTGEREAPVDLWVRPVAQAGPGIAGGPWQVNPLLVMLQWELKDYRNLQVVQGALPAKPAPVIITPMTPGTPAGTIAGMPEGYNGVAFDLLQSGQPGGIADLRSAVRWLLYREAAPPPIRWQGVVWINRSAARTSGPGPSGLVAPGYNAFPQGQLGPQQ